MYMRSLYSILFPIVTALASPDITQYEAANISHGLQINVKSSQVDIRNSNTKSNTHMDTSFHIDVTSNSNGEDNNNSVNSSAGNATTIAILKASNWTSECRDKFDPKQTTTDPCQVTGHATSISTVTAPTREATNVRESDRKGEQPKLDLGFHVVLPIAVLLVIAALVASMLVAYRWHKKQAANQALAPGQNPYPSYPHHPLSGYPLQMYDLPPYPM